MSLDNISDEDANPHTSFDPGQSETNSLICIFGNGIINKCDSLIDKWRLCLNGISTNHMNTFSLVFWTIYNEELKFENCVDVVVNLLQCFNVAIYVMDVLTCAAC